MIIYKDNFFKFPLILLLITVLSACAGQTLIKKRDLEVETKMTDTVFLEPVSADKRIIFVDIRNTSDKTLNIKGSIESSLLSRGFKIIDDPEEANFMLQANILKVGKTDLRESQSAFAGGYGGAVLGTQLSSSGSGDSALIGGLLGFAADAMIEDIYFTMITDVQIRERPLHGESITQTQSTSASQGTSTTLNQSSSGGKVAWKTYRTRIVSTANKVNLQFSEALPKLEEGLTRSLSGIF